MDQNTRIYNRWRGYSTEDCSCAYCRRHPGRKRGCALEGCRCQAERDEALRREQDAADGVAEQDGAARCPA